MAVLKTCVERRIPIVVATTGHTAKQKEEIEGAAYFFVCEGLANVLKHAEAQHTTVRFSTTANILRIEIIDDGRGFDSDAVAASGLRGLADRIEALGGGLRVASPPTGGTTLAASLPLWERRDA